MEPIQRSEAMQIEQLPSLPRDKVVTAQTSSDRCRMWVAKPPVWQGWAGIFSIRLGTEMVYYALAKHNKVPMPDSRVLNLKEVKLTMPDGKEYSFGCRNCWGTEFMEGGALGVLNDPLPREVRKKVEQTFESDQGQIESYIRMVFLDVLLRNYDRTVSNVLKVDNGEKLSLFYIDHEQSLGWRNNIQVFGRNRIKTPEEEYAAIDETVPLEKVYRWAAKHSTFADRKRIFESLDLRLSMLDELMLQVPDNWIYPDQLTDMKSGISAWWEFLFGKPYVALDARLF